MHPTPSFHDPRRRPPWVVTAAVLACVVAVLLCLATRPQRLTLARDAVGNEALILESSGGPLFMIDTAYAGAPVLSTSYLAVQHRCAGGSSVAARYRECVALLKSEVDEDARHAAVRALLARGQCRAYTSGCTMRLMGIGATSEAQADMLLCPELRWSGGGPAAMRDAGDVLVTHPLRGSVHILTTDYLLHRAPCVIQPRAGALHLRARGSLRRGFEVHRARLVGGAFVVDLEVGGATMAIVVDTGAAAALSISKHAAARMTAGACRASGARAWQSGVHGERVCADVVRTSVRLGSTLRFDDVEVFVNATDVEAADGYAGMGLLRAVDLWLEPGVVGFRASGLRPRTSDAVSPGGCDGQTLPPACVPPG